MIPRGLPRGPLFGRPTITSREIGPRRRIRRQSWRTAATRSSSASALALRHGDHHVLWFGRDRPNHSANGGIPFFATRNFASTASSTNLRVVESDGGETVDRDEEVGDVAALEDFDDPLRSQNVDSNGKQRRRLANARHSRTSEYGASSNREIEWTPAGEEQDHGHEDHSSSSADAVSRVQEQVASRKLPEMTRLVDHLRRTMEHPRNEHHDDGSLQNRDRRVDRSVPVSYSPQRVHEAILYWMSHPVRRIVQHRTRSEMKALQSAFDLVEWSYNQQDDPLFHTVVNPAMLGRLLLLLVNTTHRRATWDEIQERLQLASRVYDLMEDWIRSAEASSAFVPEGTFTVPANLLLLRARTILWSRRIYFMSFISSNTSETYLARHSRNALDDSLPVSTESVLSILEELSDRALQHHSSFHESEDTREAVLSVYQSIIASYACLGEAEKALELLGRVESVTPALQVPIEHYNFVLMAFSHRASQTGDDINCEENRSECRRAALDFWQTRMNAPHLDRYHDVTMSVLLKMLSDDPIQAMEFLESMPDPTVVHYNSVLTSWAQWSKERTTFASQQAKEILTRMKERGIAPDRISYTALMDTLLQSNDRTALDQVELLLEQSRQGTSAGSLAPEGRPDTAMYIVLLRGLLNYHRRHAESQVKEDVCLRMQRVLLKMLEDADVNVDMATYKLVLVAWAKSHSPIASENAAQLFETMKNSDLTPDLETLEHVLACLSIKVTSPEWALSQARAVREFASRHKLAETPSFFSQYLRVVSQAGQLDEAERLLKVMPSSNAESYYSVIEGHAKRRNGAPQADKLLREWNGPPSLRMMKVVMTAWSHQNDHEAARSDQRIDEIYEDAKAAVNGEPLPAFFLDGYMKAISKRPNAPFVMEHVLARMQRDYESTRRRSLKPNGSAFATVILAWAAASPRMNGAAERAEALLNRLDELSQNDVDFKPTLACYRGVLSAWALSNHPESGQRARAILERLEQQSELHANRTCYSLTLKAIGKSADPNKARSAYETLLKMKDSFTNGNRRAEPSTNEYTAAIRAIGSTRGSIEEMALAYGLAEELVVDFLNESTQRPTVQLDDYEQLYLQYLWAAYKLLPPGPKRDRVVQTFMAKCPEDVVVLPSIKDALAKVLVPS